MLRKKKFIVIFIAAVIAAAAVVSGCASSYSEAREAKHSQRDAGYATGTGAYYSEEAAAAATEEGYSEEDYNNEPEDNASAERGSLFEDTELTNDKLVYTCAIKLQSLEYAKTLENIRGRIKEFGGIIEYEHETNNDYYWYYDDEKHSSTMTLYLTIRIPTGNYEAFLASIDGEGKVIEKTSNVENISRQYSDTEAIIESLKIQESRLLEMMQKAETISEMLEIEDRLTEVQTDLNIYRTRLAQMDTDVAYSTIELTIEEVRKYTDDPEKTDTFGDRLMNALKDAGAFFAEFFEGLLYALIYIVPLAVIVLIVFLIVRKAIRSRRKKAKAGGAVKKETIVSGKTDDPNR